MINSTLVDKIKYYFLNDWYSRKEEAIGELKHYVREFKGIKGYNLYEYGNICPYYYQIRDMYSDCGINADDMDDEQLIRNFDYHIQIAVDEILREVDL